MFTIKDLYSGKVVCICETKKDVLMAKVIQSHSYRSLFFRDAIVSVLNHRTLRKASFCFDDLNVTGKDMISFMFSSAPPRLRRFQVLDEQGRSIDIRSWGKEMGEILSLSEHLDQPPRFDPKDPSFRNTPIEGTEKKKPCRISGFAMWHKTAANEATSLDDEDYDGYTPIVDHGATRKRNTGLRSQWDQYEHKQYGRDHLRKSWKDSSKGQRQWSKNTRMTRSMRQEARQFKACDMYLMGNDFESEEEQLQDSIPLYEDGYWD